MAVSRNRPKYKVKKKKKLIQKQKQKQMDNIQKKQPVTYTYHKDAETVAVPIRAWQMLNQSAESLRNIATFVSVMEQVGNQHMTDGTLLPVFDDDLEVVPGSQPMANGQVQKQIKDSFWIRGKKEEPLIVMTDGTPFTEETLK